MHEALVLQWRVLRPNATCALSRPHGTRRFRPSRADSPGWRRQSAGRNWPAGSAPAERRLCDRKGDLRLGAREWARCADSGHSTSDAALPRSPATKFSKPPKSGDGSTTSAVSAALCESAGLSSLNAVDRAADGGEDEGG